ncbi:hypothetical protein [Mycobacterium avium]|uniref:hypothetical protein n=1 Tax=Mycobacterium avium TaxID=1764 RepID=UPI001155B6E0|nr:hypothetical protein [Mycobacterium avium]
MSVINSPPPRSKLMAAIGVLREHADKFEARATWRSTIWPDAATFRHHLANLEERTQRADRPATAREVLKSVEATGRGLTVTIAAAGLQPEAIHAMIEEALRDA